MKKTETKVRGKKFNKVGYQILAQPDPIFKKCWRKILIPTYRYRVEYFGFVLGRVRLAGLYNTPTFKLDLRAAQMSHETQDYPFYLQTRITMCYQKKNNNV